MSQSSRNPQATVGVRVLSEMNEMNSTVLQRNTMLWKDESKVELLVHNSNFFDVD